jgi:3-oxoacyl-[acyl-carrier-protein] synthase-3
MKAFVVNGHDRLVFPSNFSADLDFSVLETLEQLAAVIRRDFEAKAPTGTEILERVDSGAYRSRYEVLRDLAMNLVWANRYAMTMYEKRPTRWRDLPRRRDDVFLPLLTPWEQGERKVAAVAAAWTELPPTWDADAEDRIFTSLFDIFRRKRHHAAELPPVKPTVAEITSDPENLTFCFPTHDPDHPTRSYQEILDCTRRCPSSSRSTVWRWSSTTSTRGTWPGRGWNRSGRSATTTSSWRSCRETTRCSSSSGA